LNISAYSRYKTYPASLRLYPVKHSLVIVQKVHLRINNCINQTGLLTLKQLDGQVTRDRKHGNDPTPIRFAPSLRLALSLRVEALRPLRGIQLKQVDQERQESVPAVEARDLQVVQEALAADVLELVGQVAHGSAQFVLGVFFQVYLIHLMPLVVAGLGQPPCHIILDQTFGFAFLTI